MAAETGKRIYFFSPEESDGDQSLKNLLGGKGANLAEMSELFTRRTLAREGSAPAPVCSAAAL